MNCSVCNLMLSAGSIYKHFRDHHSDAPTPEPIKTFECIECGKKFVSKYELINYGVVHSGEFFVCEFPNCEAKFKAQNALSQHRNIHTEKYKCPKCQKCFIDNSLLNVHLAKRKPPCDGGVFICDKCQQQFNHADQLKRHEAKDHPDPRKPIPTFVENQSEIDGELLFWPRFRYFNFSN